MRRDVAAEQLLEAERLPRGRRRAGGVGAPHLVGGAGGDHRLDAGVDPAVERSRSIIRATSSVGWRVSAVHSWVRRRRALALVEQLERADDALGVGARDRGRGRRVARGELGVQRGRALAGEPARVALAAAGVGGRPQVELGERRAQVQPVPPTTIGRRPAATRPSISAWARRA